MSEWTFGEFLFRSAWARCSITKWHNDDREIWSGGDLCIYCILREKAQSTNPKFEKDWSEELKTKLISKVFNLQYCVWQPTHVALTQANRMLSGKTRGCLDNDRTDIYDEMYQQFILNLVVFWWLLGSQVLLKDTKKEGNQCKCPMSTWHIAFGPDWKSKS